MDSTQKLSRKLQKPARGKGEILNVEYFALTACGLRQKQAVLEVQFKPELELPRVEGGGWLAVVPAVAFPLAKGVDHLIERVCGRFVEAVEEVEDLTDQVEADAFAEADPSRHAGVDGEIIVRDAH